MFYIGCPLWSYKEWVGNFFPAHTPASEFLRLYSRKLNAVEGNTVFYALPSSETIARWREETPPTFRICPKVLRSISHTGQLANSRTETTLFIDRMLELGERLGTIFLQLPPSFGPAHFSELETFLNFWPSDVSLAVEVRHPDFYTEANALQLNTLLAHHNTARVLVDTRPMRIGSPMEQEVMHARERKPNLPLQIVVTTDVVFLRYIGHVNMEVNNPFLDTWAQQIAKWLRQDKTVYVFCHSPFQKYSPEICASLYQRVGDLLSLPPLTYEEEPDEAGIYQQRLF